MAFGVNELLAQTQEGKWRHRDYQGKVQPFQGEDLALTQRGRHWLLAHECPLPPPTVVQVLEGGTGAEVTLKESL